MAAPTFNSASPSGTYVALAAENSLQANSPTVALPTDYIAPIKSGGIASTTNVQVAPTVTASSYTAGYVCGGLMTFANATLAAQSGVLESIRVTCKTVQTTPLKVYVFDTNPSNSTWTEHAAPSINVADIPYLMGVYTLASADSGLGTHTIWNLDGIGKSFVSASTSLYAIMTVVATPTFGATSDVTVKLGVICD